MPKNSLNNDSMISSDDEDDNKSNKSKIPRNFLTKYVPRKTSEIAGNINAIATIKKWIMDFEGKRDEVMKNNEKKILKKTGQVIKKTVKKNKDKDKKESTNKKEIKRGRTKKDLPKGCAIVVGNHGTAKSIAVKLAVEECKYEPHYLNIENIKSMIVFNKNFKKLKEGSKRGRKTKKKIIPLPIKDSGSDSDKIEIEDELENSDNAQEEKKTKTKTKESNIKSKKNVKVIDDDELQETRGSKNTKEIGSNVSSYMKGLKITKSIRDFLNNKPQKPTKTKTKKIVLIADGLESITSPNETKVIKFIQQLNDLYWFYPVIFISDTNHSKLISDLKKKSLEVRFYPPSDSELIQLIKKITVAEKIKYAKGVDELICDIAQGDIRRLITTLSDLKDTYGKTIISEKNINEYKNISIPKDLELGIYDISKKLFYNYNSYNECMKYYNIDTGLVPLIFHENYLKILNKKSVKTRATKEKTMKTIKNISEMITIGDTIDNIMHSYQIWDLASAHGCYSTIIPCYYINQYNVREPITDYKYDFTADYNRSSIKSINKINISNAEECFGNKSQKVNLHRTKLLKHYIDNDNIKKCCKTLLKGYPSIKTVHVSSLLKIDKIKNTKSNLSSKEENQFNEYLNQ